jgi:pyrrolidone-carboxylate peptidase
MSARAILILTGSVWMGCSSSAGTGAASEREPGAGESQPSESSPSEAPSNRPRRVLVTGFHDWRELGDPPAIWRCRDNPSCRLLIGDAGLEARSAPDRHAGPLVERLEEAAPEIEWSFRTMPVTWNVFAEVPTEHDVIINIGLGVYDRFDALQLERGAYNLQDGQDALGRSAGGAIDPNRPTVLEPPATSAIAARIDALVGTTIAGYEILGRPARPENSYLCNQTHWFALAAVHSGEGPREAYFLHIPYAKDGDHEPLAEAVAGVVLALVR